MQYYRFKWKNRYINLDGQKPDDIPQELWDTLKALFETIYNDQEDDN